MQTLLCFRFQLSSFFSPCHHGIDLFIQVMSLYSALCCYPNINSAIRNLGLNTPTAPIFLQFNYFRENIWVIIWVQFHFLYIFVGRVDRIHKTSHTRMLSFYFFASDLQCFGDELNVSSKTAPQIFELIKIEANIWILQNCVFTMNCSTDKKIVFWSFLGRGFIYMWEKFQRCQSSNSCFLQKCPTFWTDNMQILFFSLNICIFTPVQTKKIAVGRKMSKI